MQTNIKVKNVNTYISKAFPGSLRISFLDCECQLAQSSLADNVSCQSFVGSDVCSLSAGNGPLE
jgi:hypothetical protein